MPPGFEEALFELLVQGLPPRNVPALVAPSGRVLVPVRAALELTGTPVQASADGTRFTVPGPRGAGTITLDLAARTLTGLATASLAEDEAVVAGGEGYAAAERIGALLSGTAQVDLGALRVVLLREPPFPAQERLAVSAARRRAQRLGTAPRPDLPDVPFRPRTGGGVLEWGVSGNVPGGIPSTVSLRTGLGVWGGMLRLGGVAFDPGGEGGGYGEVNASYHRVFPGSPYVRQVQVGDVVAEGLRAHSLRGVVLTNAPFARDPEFGELLFAPRLPRGVGVRAVPGRPAAGLFRRRRRGRARAPAVRQHARAGAAAGSGGRAGGVQRRLPGRRRCSCRPAAFSTPPAAASARGCSGARRSACWTCATASRTG